MITIKYIIKKFFIVFKRFTMQTENNETMRYQAPENWLSESCCIDLRHGDVQINKYGVIDGRNNQFIPWEVLRRDCYTGEKRKGDSEVRSKRRRV